MASAAEIEYIFFICYLLPLSLWTTNSFLSMIVSKECIAHFVNWIQYIFDVYEE